jgi:hypothetical protein
MDSRVSLRYVGPAVDDGAMDVYKASANMIAFSEFVVEASRITFGSSVSAKAEVKGFSQGSFVTDLVFYVTGTTASVFSAVSPADLWRVCKEAIALWKHLRGSQPAKVEHHGQTVSVTNNNGQIMQVQTESMTLVFNQKSVDAVGRFVRDGLEDDGIEFVEVRADSDVIASVERNERSFFVQVAPSTEVTNVTFTMALVIEAPVFKDGNKWRFWDGQRSIHADIEDQDFLARVNEGERFGKGDVLRAEVRISQEQSAGKISATTTVVRVLEHVLASQQLRLN